MFQNVMTRIIWKHFCCSLHFQWWFRFLEKVLIWLKNVISTKKIPINKTESFLKSNIVQNHICKIETWNFNATDLFYIFIKCQRNALLSKKISQNWSLRETGPSHGKKFAFSDNPRQNIWTKILITSIISITRPEKFDIYFCVFF